MEKQDSFVTFLALRKIFQKMVVYVLTTNSCCSLKRLGNCSGRIPQFGKCLNIRIRNFRKENIISLRRKIVLDRHPCSLYLREKTFFIFCQFLLAFLGPQLVLLPNLSEFFFYVRSTVRNALSVVSYLLPPFYQTPLVRQSTF